MLKRKFSAEHSGGISRGYEFDGDDANSLHSESNPLIDSNFDFENHYSKEVERGSAKQNYIENEFELYHGVQKSDFLAKVKQNHVTVIEALASINVRFKLKELVGIEDPYGLRPLFEVEEEKENYCSVFVPKKITMKNLTLYSLAKNKVGQTEIKCSIKMLKKLKVLPWFYDSETVLKIRFFLKQN